jgi:hypothetical protein
MAKLSKIIWHTGAAERKGAVSDCLREDFFDGNVRPRTRITTNVFGYTRTMTLTCRLAGTAFFGAIDG